MVQGSRCLYFHGLTLVGDGGRHMSPFFFFYPKLVVFFYKTYVNVAWLVRLRPKTLRCSTVCFVQLKIYESSPTFHDKIAPLPVLYASLLHWSGLGPWLSGKHLGLLTSGPGFISRCRHVRWKFHPDRKCHSLHYHGPCLSIKPYLGESDIKLSHSLVSQKVLSHFDSSK